MELVLFYVDALFFFLVQITLRRSSPLLFFYTPQISPHTPAPINT